MKFTTSFWLTCLGSLVILDQIKRACSHHWVGNSLLDLDDGSILNGTANLTGWSSPHSVPGSAYCTLSLPVFAAVPRPAFSMYALAKTYTNLPPHNTLLISVKVYLVNNITTEHSFGMTIDSDPVAPTVGPYETGPYPMVYLNGWNTSQFPISPRNCTGAVSQMFKPFFKQLQVQLVQTYNHSASEFTLFLSAMKLNGNFNESDTLKVFFREVNITFLNTTNSSYSQCVRSVITSPSSVQSYYWDLPPPSPIGGCPCPLANQYQSPANSGNCSSCHATCATCYGPLASNCLTCDTGKVLNGSTGTCQDPSPGRLLLNPSLSSQDQAEEMWCLWIVLGVAIIGIMFWSLGSYKAKRDSLRKKVTHDRLDSVEIAELQTTDQ